MRRRKLWIRLVAYSVALLALGGVLWYQLDQRRVAEAHNRAVEQLLDQGEFEQAVAELEPLAERAGFHIRSGIERSLAIAYLGMGDDPGRSLEEAAEWYRKAETLQPDLIDGERREVIEAAGQ